MNHHLTPTETRVMELVAYGKRNRQISDALGLTRKTVATYMTRIMSKLEVTNRTEAAIKWRTEIQDARPR